MSQATSISRREFLAASSAALALGALAPAHAADDVTTAEALAAARSPQYEAALKALLGLRQAAEARVAVTIPETNENGNIVPYKLAVESAMTDADTIKTLTLLSTGNPQPVVATFHFTPLSGRASVAGRMRLAKSQTVVAIAETGAGEMLMGQTFVAVTVGGCGNE